MADENQTEVVAAADQVSGIDAAICALRLIAAGRRDCGRPLSGDISRQIARKVLIAMKEDW